MPLDFPQTILSAIVRFIRRLAMATPLADLTASRTKPAGTARLIYGALLGKPAGDSASPRLYEVAMEEYEEHIRPGAGFDVQILSAQRGIRAPGYGGYLTEKILTLKCLELRSNGMWVARRPTRDDSERNDGFENTVDGYPHPFSIFAYDGDGLLVAWRDLLRIDVLRNGALAGYQEAHDDIRRRKSIIRNLASPSLWKMIEYYAADLTQLGSKVAEASKWWRSEVVTWTGQKLLDSIADIHWGSANASFVQRYADLLRKHQLRLLRSLEDLTDIIDGILVSFASKVFIAPAPGHPLDVLEAHLLDGADSARISRARLGEQQDDSCSHTQQASAFCVVD